MIRAILFQQGDTLWHFPRLPAPGARLCIFNPCGSLP